MNPFIIRNRDGLAAKPSKQGLHLHFEHEVHPYVREWIIVYARWLRQTLRFPVRLDVFCKACEKIKCLDGSRAFASIVVSDNLSIYPRIKLGCGNFQDCEEVSEQMIQETWLILFTFSHEIVHYFQMINGFDLSRSRGIEWQASFWAKRMLTYFDSLYDDEDSALQKESTTSRVPPTTPIPAQQTM